jgi:RecB family endonuclease NucS
MRVLVARCEIAYEGRLVTRLAPGDRVILFKGDGSVAVHNTKGAKPVNYMAGPTVVEEDGSVIRVRRAQSGELLTILVEAVHADARHELEDGAALERDGRELQLHALIADAPHLVEDGLVVVQRERPTDVGPIDFFCRDAAGTVTLLEVKRVKAVAAAVEQVVRYREQVERDPACVPVRAVVVAPEFAPQARALAATRGVECIVLDVAALRAGVAPALRLFDG